jgi:hypothetical protein
MPGRPGLAGSTAEAVARGLGRAQSSSRQPLPGLRPLGLRMEVCYYFFILGSGPLAWLFCCCSVNFFDSALTIIFFLVESRFFNKRGFQLSLDPMFESKLLNVLFGFLLIHGSIT